MKKPELLDSINWNLGMQFYMTLFQQIYPSSLLSNWLVLQYFIVNNFQPKRPTIIWKSIYIYIFATDYKY